MLSATDKARYARQVLLTEIGLAGQTQLLRSAVALPMTADARAAEVAADYLQRAGLRVVADGTPIEVSASESVRALAGRAELREAAAALTGAFAAVEAIKQALGVGEQAALPSSLTLSGEPAP